MGAHRSRHAELDVVRLVRNRPPPAVAVRTGDRLMPFRPSSRRPAKSQRPGPRSTRSQHRYPQCAREAGPGVEPEPGPGRLVCPPLTQPFSDCIGVLHAPSQQPPAVPEGLTANCQTLQRSSLQHAIPQSKAVAVGLLSRPPHWTLDALGTQGFSAVQWVGGGSTSGGTRCPPTQAGCLIGVSAQTPSQQPPEVPGGSTANCQSPHSGSLQHAVAHAAAVAARFSLSPLHSTPDAFAGKWSGVGHRGPAGGGVGGPLVAAGR